jgi:hypothetical protein
MIEAVSSAVMFAITSSPVRPGAMPVTMTTSGALAGAVCAGARHAGDADMA